MDGWAIMGFSVSQRHPNPEKSCVSVPFYDDRELDGKREERTTWKADQLPVWNRGRGKNDWRKICLIEAKYHLLSIAGELVYFLLFVSSHQNAAWLSSLPASAVFPIHHEKDTEPKRRSGEGKSFKTTLHLRHHCQRGGSCCLLPGCSGRGDCHSARRLHRSRADRQTGSRCLLAAGPGSLGGSPGQRGDLTPPTPCTWRTPLENR